MQENMNKAAQLQIQELIETITVSNSWIDRIARENIPDFHFLDHKVSQFWECEESPIGWCLWEFNDQGNITGCRYCHQPVERK
jgi:hypothetical protein